MTYLVNGVDLYDSENVVLVEGTVWRPDVSTVRSPVTVAGRHGSIDRGLPVFGEPKLTLVVDLDARDSPADLEAAGTAVIALLSTPQLVITRVSGNLVTSVEARLESVSHSGFLWGRTVTVTAVFALPSVFWREDVQTSPPATLTGSASDVTVAHLAGSSAPVRGAVLRITGPATSVTVNEALTGTGVTWAGTGLVAGQYLYIDVDRLRAWRTSSASQWTQGGTDVSGGLDYPAGGRLQLWPRITPVKTEMRRNSATVPTPIDATGWNSNNGATYPVVYDAAGGRRTGTGAKKATRTATTPNFVLASFNAVGGTAFSNAGTTTVVPGEVWTLSVYVKSAVAFSTFISVAFFDAAGAQVGTSTNGATVSGSAGEWVRPFHTVTVPAGVVNMRILNLSVSRTPLGTVTVGGEETWATDCLIERKPALDDWFSGSSRPAGFGSEWVATPALSATILYVSNPSATMRAVILSASAAGASGATQLTVQAGRCFL